MVTFSYYQKYLNFSPEKFQEFQFQKLRAFVLKIKKQSVFYRKKLEKCKTIRSFSDFEQIPILEQSELRDTPIHEFRACPWSEIRTISGSSGTTGNAKTVLWTEDSLKKERIWNTLEYLMMGVTNSSRFALVMSIGMSRCLGIIDAIRATGAFMIPMGRLNSDTDMDFIINKMKEFQVTHIHGVTSRLISLTQRAKQLGYDLKKDFSLRYIIGGSMATSDVSKRHLEHEWGAEYFDAYGANEASFIAGECNKHDGLHVFPGINYVEVVDPITHKQIKDNSTIGEILITNMANLGTPLLRYRLGDMGTMTFEPCSCGLSFPRIHINGRSIFMLTIDGTKIHAYEIDAILSTFPKFTNHYRAIVRKSAGIYRITFEIECFDTKAITKADVQLLIKKLETISAVFNEKIQAGWVKINVEPVVLGTLPRSSRDKIKDQVIYE